MRIASILGCRWHGSSSSVTSYTCQKLGQWWIMSGMVPVFLNSKPNIAYIPPWSPLCTACSCTMSTGLGLVLMYNLIDWFISIKPQLRKTNSQAHWTNDSLQCHTDMKIHEVSVWKSSYMTGKRPWPNRTKTDQDRKCCRPMETADHGPVYGLS